MRMPGTDSKRRTNVGGVQLCLGCDNCPCSITWLAVHVRDEPGNLVVVTENDDRDNGWLRAGHRRVDRVDARVFAHCDLCRGVFDEVPRTCEGSDSGGKDAGTFTRGADYSAAAGREDRLAQAA